ncbi:MAG: hypothetical protein ABIO04_13985 [Ferruginibacter sp.]
MKQFAMTRLLCYLLFILVALNSCKSKMLHAGVTKVLSTGLKTTYKNLHPENVILVMNGTTINDADIPLGESFILVNDKTTGLEAKDGKHLVGCSLIIKDMNDQVLMNEPDLFEQTGTLEQNETTVLRCTVNTGKPMEAGKKYHVVSTFWDKYGNGTIENDITVKMTDPIH